MNWHSLKEEQIFKQLHTSKKGLKESEIQERLKKFGKNELRKIRRLNALKILFSQFTSFLIIILIIAAVISGILGHWLDFGVIMGVVVINCLFGFFQEYKAEKAIEKLRNILVPKAHVLRNGKVEEIDARQLVPGDILILNEGDKIMADSRVLEAASLQTNEAALTGESVPVEKKPGITRMSMPLADRTNMLYQGTKVVKGNCKALVVATGMNTELGRIATLVQEIKQEKNPLRKRLDTFGKQIGAVVIVLAIIITLFGFFKLGLDKFQLFLTAVSLAVSAIPEGLPAVITITLALATQRMLKVKSLIRKLPAAETLGRATIIATDKTGTITEEKMKVQRVYVNNEQVSKFNKSKEMELLFKIGVLCSNARIEEKKNSNGKLTEYVVGDPTEKALLVAADEYGIDKKKQTEQNPRITEFPFSSKRKMMSIVRKCKQGYRNYVKGAPEVIVPRCNSELVKGQIKKISEKRRKQLVSEFEEMASKGLRVLGFAYKELIRDKKQIKPEVAERNLVFVGFQGMIDPPRPEVRKALKTCQKAGIRVLMITGDSALTAKAVGHEIGLQGKIVTAEKLEKMSDQELSKKLPEIAIFARISPEDKLRIVTLLRKNKEIVAVTGDGVNDAPALKKADIGIAVGRGTDVAKDSSDIILLDNNFASIVKAVSEGRRVYDNIKKFVKQMLSANTNEITITIFAILMGFPLPLLPLQILWMNLVTSFPALALAVEPAEEDVMKRKPNKKGILRGTIGFILLAGVLAFIISFMAFYFYFDNLDAARTMAATTTIIFEMFLVFNCKDKHSAFRSPLNKWLIFAVILSVGLQLLFMYTPLNFLFGFTPLALMDWAKIVGACIVTFLILEIAKRKLE